MNPTTTRSGVGAKVATLASLVILALVALATPAAAHVNGAAELAEGGAVRITLSFSHGCEGEPTTGLRAQAPEGATEVTPVDVDGWTSSVDGLEVAWTGGSVPDHDEAEFSFTARLAQAPGEEVLVPTIQECPNSSIAWIEPPTDDHSEASSPAPAITVPEGAVAPEEGAAAGDDPATEPGTEDGEGAAAEDEAATAVSADEDGLTASGDPTEAETAQASPDDQGANAGGTTGLIVFLVVLAVILGGGGYLYLQNRKRPEAN